MANVILSLNIVIDADAVIAFGENAVFQLALDKTSADLEKYGDCADYHNEFVAAVEEAIFIRKYRPDYIPTVHYEHQKEDDINEFAGKDYDYDNLTVIDDILPF